VKRNYSVLFIWRGVHHRIYGTKRPEKIKNSKTVSVRDTTVWAA
jgi:hypothetical protein